MAYIETGSAPSGDNTLVTRTLKGSPLSQVDFDNNWDVLAAKVTETNDDLSETITIDASVGNQALNTAGSVGYYVNLYAAKQATLILDHDPEDGATTAYTFTTDYTITSNIELKINRGALITVPAGVTLTINASLEAGLYQIFSGGGTVAFGSPCVLYAKWYGVLADNSTNDNAAMQLAVTSALTAPTAVIKLPMSEGIMLTGITIPAGSTDLTIEGYAYNQTKIRAHGDHDGTSPLFLIGKVSPATTTNRIMFKNVWFYQTGSVYTDTLQCAGIKLINTNNATIEDCHFNRFQNAIYGDDADDLRIIGDTKVVNCGYFGSGEGTIHLDNCNTVFILGATIERNFEYYILITTTGTILSSGIHIQSNKIHGRTPTDDDNDKMKNLILVNGANNVLINGNHMCNVRGSVGVTDYSGIVVRDEDGVTAITGAQAGVCEKTHTIITGNSIEGSNDHMMIEVDVGDTLSRVIIDANQYTDAFVTGAAVKICANVLSQNIVMGTTNAYNEVDNFNDIVSDDSTAGFGSAIWWEYQEAIPFTAAVGTKSCFTVQSNYTWVPMIVQVRFDTAITAVAGEYISLGQDVNDERVDFGVSTVALADRGDGTPGLPKNTKFQKIAALSATLSPIESADILKLMSTVSIDNNTARASNWGDADEQITVRISGWMISDLPDA